MLQALKPSEVQQWAKICFAAGRRAMLHGDPGTGKSQLVGQISDSLFAGAYAKEAKAGLRPWYREIRAAQYDAVDLRGLPLVKDGKTFWALPDALPTDPRGGILFLDEINRGPEMVQNALFQLCDQGRIGDYVMPPTWHVAAAVNDKDGGARKMSAALLSRFIHVDLKADLDDLLAHGASKNWNEFVLAFLRTFPKLLHDFRPVERVSPNPRAWEFVSQIMDQKPPQNMLLALVAGAVGEAAAIEFCGFVRLWGSLPAIEDVMTHPLTTPIPVGSSCQYAIASALARRVTAKTFGAAIQYLERMSVEYSVASVTEAVRRFPELRGHVAYTKWCVKNPEVLIQAAAAK